MKPGATALTPTLNAATSFDSAFVNPMMPRLRRRVVRLAAAAGDAGARRHVDDRARSLLDHL